MYESVNAQTHLIDRWISYIMYDDLLICLYVVVHGRWGNVVITNWAEWGNSSEQKTNMYNNRFDWLHFRLNTRIMTTKTLTRYPSTCFIVQFVFLSCMNGLYTIYMYMSHYWTISIDCVTKNFISVSKCSCRSHLWLVHICLIHSIAAWQTIDV